MFRRLANLFRRNLEPQTGQVPSVLPILDADPRISEESTSAAMDALKRFMHLVTAHLGAFESNRLIDVASSGFDAYDDASEAFEAVVHGDEGQKRGQWFVIQCDWKAHEELEWQVSEIAASFGILERWSWAATEAKSRTVPTGLCDAARWAEVLGFKLLHLDLGGDAFHAVMVNGDDADDAYSAAVAAGLNVLRTTEFEKANA